MEVRDPQSILGPPLPLVREVGTRHNHRLLTSMDGNLSKVRESRLRVPRPRSLTSRPDGASRPESTAVFGESGNSPARTECASGSGKFFASIESLGRLGKDFDDDR